MDANKLWMLRDFIGTNKVLFRIPVYQRNYDWSEANCGRLLDDIYEIIQSGEKHFLGTIVFMAAKSGGCSPHNTSSRRPSIYGRARLRVREARSCRT